MSVYCENYNILIFYISINISVLLLYFYVMFIYVQINESSSIFHLSYVGGYVYLNPPNETLVILESILDSISSSRPLDELYSKSSISPHKVYLVMCPNLNMWCRAIVEDFIFTDHKVNKYLLIYICLHYIYMYA